MYLDESDSLRKPGKSSQYSYWILYERINENQWLLHDMNEKTSVDKVSEMPEVSDFVPELVCLGIDVAICGVIYLCFPSCYPKVKTEY